MRMSDWSSDVCSSDVCSSDLPKLRFLRLAREGGRATIGGAQLLRIAHRDIKRRPRREDEIPAERAFDDVLQCHLERRQVLHRRVPLGGIKRREDVEYIIIERGEGDGRGQARTEEGREG